MLTNNDILNADYPLTFINSLIKQSSQKSSNVDDFIMPPSLFEIPKKVDLVETPYCSNNEASSKQFIKKLMSLQIAYMICVFSGSQKLLNCYLNLKLNIDTRHV